MTTASAPTTVSSPSCCRCGRSDETTWSVTAMPMQIDHRGRGADPDLAQGVPRGPAGPRNAAMIPTISAASRPSRSPITNVGSKSRPPPRAVSS